MKKPVTAVRADAPVPAKRVSQKKPSSANPPYVWLGMDQKQLDDAYDQRVWAANREHAATRWRLASGTGGRPHRTAAAFVTC